MVFAIHWHESAMDLHVFPIPIPSPASLSIPPLWAFPVHQPWALSHASNLGWWSVSPLIVYLFQCCSLRTSHLHLLPQSLKVCSVHLCLFFCFAHRVIITIFKNVGVMGSVWSHIIFYTVLYSSSNISENPIKVSFLCMMHMQEPI